MGGQTTGIHQSGLSVAGEARSVVVRDLKVAGADFGG